jgi:hypothetical protein
METKNNDSTLEQKIVAYADENFWFLEDGSLVPNRLCDFDNGMSKSGVGSLANLMQLLEAGTVYPTYLSASLVAQYARGACAVNGLEKMTEEGLAQSESEKKPE